MNEENSFEQQAKAKEAEIERLRNIVRATEVERDAGDQVCDNLRAEIREKDAAIERLKGELAIWKRNSDEWQEQSETLVEAAENKAELKAEIERLKLQHEEFLLKHEREKNLLLTTLDKQAGEILRLQGLVKQWSETAEIERLKAEIKDQMTLIEDINYHKQLITELCNALSWYVEPEADNGLIQRAREAAK